MNFIKSLLIKIITFLDSLDDTGRVCPCGGKIRYGGDWAADLDYCDRCHRIDADTRFGGEQ